MAKLSKIESIDEASTAKLKNVGITTIEKLLSEGSTLAGRKNISKKAKVSEKQVGKWVNHADLFRIKGIAGLKSELLEAAGVPTMKDLAKKNPEQLHSLMLTINDKKNMVQRVPGLVQVKRWVDTAKKIAKVVK